MTVTTFLGDESPRQRPAFAARPVVMGTRGVVTSGHYLATAAGFRIMEQGGNAIDAAAAMCFCLNLLEPQSNGLAGEVPTLIYSARERKVHALSGMGWSAQAFTIDWCREHGIDLIPGDGYLPACVPAVVGTWAAALARFGTMSFGDILQPAIELAENGYPVYQGLHDALANNQAKYTELYPSTGEVYLPSGQAPDVGALHRNPAWAETLRILCRAEQAAAGRGRVAGIEAARDAFYKGEIAERIIDFITANPVEDASGAAHAGLLTYEDFAEWEARLRRARRPELPRSGCLQVLQLDPRPGVLATAGPAGKSSTWRRWATTRRSTCTRWLSAPSWPSPTARPTTATHASTTCRSISCSRRTYAAQRCECWLVSSASLEMRPGDLGDGVPAIRHV